MTKLARTAWLSPLDTCNVCQAEFGEHGAAGTTMFDAALPGLGGMWGNVCQTCFDRHGAALGVGRGQQYDLLPYGAHKAWLGVAGFE